ncbi:MAG TPA: M20 family metallopeptidase [Ktedonobacterales bacterium]|jgi:amidohydrolase|nr:M20 family metallopeptidase [Ktedonobacterales bacterium]
MDAKAATRARMLAERDRLIDLSHRIHANPEIAFEEERASHWVAEALAAAGFTVELGIYGLPTALRARSGSGPLQFAFCAEYDALPGIGHACGHNLIAAMAVGAAIATAAVADDLGVTVNVIGTPAEEVGDAGGKILLLERGAFDGMHAAMMVHPTPFDVAEPSLIAAAMFDVHYTGKEAHPVASPTEGINAADALLIAQVAIGLLRQHLRPTDNIHGITTKGGDAPNIIPAHTAARYVMRARSLDQLAELRPRIVNCFQAGAVATGSTLEIVGGEKPYAEVTHDKDLASLYRRNAEALGRNFIESPMAASTDMGNISRVMPTLHPSIGIGSLPAVNHQPAFAAHCATETADQALFDGALAMAWTVIDVATDETVRARLLARS